ncbi:hypothetical protein ACWDSL_32365 [Streptomyces sp. NPDC000941]
MSALTEGFGFSVSFASEHHLPPDQAAELARKERTGKEHLLWPGLTLVPVIIAVIMLLTPADFHETVERQSGITEDISLKCGSVVSPRAERAEDGFSRYRGQCNARRTQRLGYAGLVLSGAVVIAAVGAAVQRRPRGSVAA